MLDLIDRVRDESDGEHPVRLVFEPKSSRIDTDTFINTLMAQTSLEGNVSMNLVMMGLDNRPAQKNLKTILQEWLDFRVVTVTRRLKFRLNQVEKRLHILEGRLKVFLHIDEVIKVIRESDDPKADLMAAFGLTEIQAEDILEIRLRQLARLEGFKLEKELNELREEQGRLNILLGDENEKRKLIIKEMQADMKQFGDARRTLVEEAGRAVLTQTTADEPITLILSEKGWIRSRAGHNLDLSQTAFKEGDRLKQTLEGRTVLPVVILDSLGRTYTLDAAEIPGGRGDGVPVSSLIELQNGAKPVAMLTGQPEQHYLLSGSGGYGFVAICLFFFAFTTILGWYYFAEINVRYLLGAKFVKLLQILVVAFVFIGSVQKIDLVWELADMFNGLMVIPNLIAIILLSPVVVRLLSDFNDGKSYDANDYK